jgi:hypothetical protein
MVEVREYRIIHPVKARFLYRAKKRYLKRLTLTPQIKPQCLELEKSLAPLKGHVEVFKQGAELYSSFRKTSCLFVRFDPFALDAFVGSTSGIFKGKVSGFPGQNPPRLIMKSLYYRRGFHLPDLNQDDIEVETMVKDRLKKEKQYFYLHTELNSLIPESFPNYKKGALLLTPIALGVQKRSKYTRTAPWFEWGYGVIYEWQERPFSWQSMQEALTYSSLFAWQITKKIMEEVEGKVKRS